MRLPLSLAAVALAGLASLPAPAQAPARVDYQIEIDPTSVFSTLRDRDGKPTRIVSLQFQIKRPHDGAVVTSVPADEVLVEEDGAPVAHLEIFQPRSQKLTAVLALDISGSMARGNKMEQAKAAALAFLDRLDERADVGLILFDHEIKLAVPPARDPAQVLAHRARLRRLIQDARPQGGTAWIDASIKAVDLLRGVTGRKAVIVMTDGVDMNSKARVEDAVEAGQIGELPIYTVGIGQPGRNEAVTTVLVLDRSGSMQGKADDGDALKKLDALKAAATRFVDLMRPGARTVVQTFSTRVDPLAGDFSADRAALAARIKELRPEGGTALYDATFAGVETLLAKNPPGTRAVVVLTDGVDEAPGSKRPAEEVIARARETKIPLYMLGLGRRDEINEPVMQRMAKETGGEYYHAGSQKKLLEVFENLSIHLHDDGIDEASLRKLADGTGGKYIHVSEVSKLTFFYQQLADELQQTYKVTFDSRRASHDGTARGIDVKIVRGGVVLSANERGVDYVVRGIVVPQMNYGVYLAFLAGLAALLAFPALLRRLYKGFGGA